MDECLHQEHQELAVVVLMEGSNHCAEECPGYTDPLLPVVVTKGQVAEKQTQEQTLLLQATCPLPEQEEAGRAGFFVLH